MKIVLHLYLFFGLLPGLMLSSAYAQDFNWNFNSNKMAYIKIEHAQFVVPTAYIWNKSGQLEGDGTRTLVVALLPDMQPRTEANKAKFDGLNGAPDVVHIELRRLMVPASSAEGKDWRNARKRQKAKRYIQNYTVGKSTEGSYGFKMYKAPAYSTDLLYRTLSNGDYYYIKCDDATKNSTPDCNSGFYFSEKFYVSYQYKKQHLKRWQMIDQNVRGLVKSFELKATLHEGKD